MTVKKRCAASARDHNAFMSRSHMMPRVVTVISKRRHPLWPLFAQLLLVQCACCLGFRLNVTFGSPFRAISNGGSGSSPSSSSLSGFGMPARKPSPRYAAQQPPSPLSSLTAPGYHSRCAENQYQCHRIYTDYGADSFLSIANPVSRRMEIDTISRHATTYKLLVAAGKAEVHFVRTVLRRY